MVADASPLIALARIGRLDLLPRLYEFVDIPPAVSAEVTRRRPGIGKPWPAWLRVRAARDVEAVGSMSTALKRGETEAIALARELRVPLLIDEKTGRRVARSFGLQVIGTLGLLLEAKNGGAVDRVGPLLDQLHEAGFHSSRGLRVELLHRAGET